MDAEFDYGAALAGCVRGDRAALKALYDAEAPQLLGVALRILRRRELAEDAVQDAFVLIWRHAAQYDRARGSPRGWINAIVRNRALSMIRDGSREEPTEAADIDALRESDAIAAAFRGFDDRSRLKRCLGRLDAVKRDCVMMAYLYGYTHGEIAGRMGVPLGTAKAWVRRGLRTLRECMS